MDPQFLAAVAAILWLDLLLSGDNALIIAVIADGLPERQKRWAMVFGTLAAMGLRIGGAFVAALLMSVPFLSIGIGLYLLIVAVKLVLGGGDEAERKPSTSLFGAVLAISLADLSLSMDNVFAVAAIAKGDHLLMAIGIGLSVVLMMVGAALILRLIGRFPILKWLGSAFLGWVAGGIVLHDPLLHAYADTHLVVSGMATLGVIGLALILNARKPREAA